MPVSQTIEFGSHQLVLLADRAIHWPKAKTLILADVHLGKDASFRAAGLPVPAGNSTKDLARIEALLAQTSADRLLVLGDLVHNRASHQSELAAAFSRWRSAHQQLNIQLIRGNHDRHAGPTPADWNITSVGDLYEEDSLCFAHSPQESGKNVLCGHVHPVIAVRDYDGTYARICCFVADPAQLMLPAFGSFTGGYTIKSEPDRRVFVCTGKSVFKFEA